jgi:hypothetical protein
MPHECGSLPKGEFFASHEAALAGVLPGRQTVQFEDLRVVCRTWFGRPPRPLIALSMADSHGPTRQLALRAPSIEGVR